MNKKNFIKDFAVGDLIESKFLVTEKELRQKKGGGEYLFLLLRDKTGLLPAYMWENFEEAQNKINVGIVVLAKGIIQAYQNKIKLMVQKIEISKEEIDIENFLPTSKEKPEILFENILKIIDSLRNNNLKELLFSIYNDPEIKPLLLICPAAKIYHHAYIGGLLEHTFKMAVISEEIIKNYEKIDRDILIAGILLHDIGKIWEFNPQNLTEYTKEGIILGHIVMGVQLIERKISNIKDFPKELKDNLVHLIISHHGQLEFGSPKRPKLKEAILLHLIDLIDSEINGFEECLKQQEGEATFSKQLDRLIFKT